MKPDAIKVGSRINFIRKKLGLTMQEFGHKVSNSPRSTVSTWEHGGNLPSKEKMSQIAKLGQVNEDWIKWGDFEEYINEYISFLVIPITLVIGNISLILFQKTFKKVTL